MLNILISIVINVALLVLWSLIFYFFDQKKTIILTGVGLGILGVFGLAGFGYFWLNTAEISLTEAQNKTIVAPIVEESSKLLFIFLVFRLSRMTVLSGKRSHMVFGASLGLGFAFIENFGFVANFLNVLFRGFSSWLMHIATATLLAYSVGQFQKSKRNVVLVLAFFGFALVIHGFFNYVVLLLGSH